MICANCKIPLDPKKPYNGSAALSYCLAPLCFAAYLKAAGTVIEVVNGFDDVQYAGSLTRGKA